MTWCNLVNRHQRFGVICPFHLEELYNAPNKWAAYFFKILIKSVSHYNAPTMFVVTAVTQI